MQVIQPKSTTQIVTKNFIEFFFLGIYGYLFNRICNWTYETTMGEPAELPMRIGFVFVYYIGFAYPIMHWLYTYLNELVVYLQQVS